MQVREGRHIALYSLDKEQDHDLRIKLTTVETEDRAKVETVVWTQPGTKSKTAIVHMHPASPTLQSYLARALAPAGYATARVLSRYAGDDSNLVFENILLDIAGAIKMLKAEGFDHVVLFGSSGGGSMFAYYQSQAESPDVTSTPAGDLPDLTKADLPPADALVISNAHPGRHIIGTRSLDPSLVNENDPIAADPDLDLFNKKNGPPFKPEWLKRYREAQVERNRRITVWCKSKLAELDRIAHPVVKDFPFIVYRTVAEPLNLDPSIDPSDRAPGETIWGDPYTLNYYAPSAHMGRISTLRSWLSQWGLETSNCDLFKHVARVQAPSLFIQGTAETHLSTAKIAYESSASKDKQVIYVKGANHMLYGQPDIKRQYIGHIVEWLQQRGL